MALISSAERCSTQGDPLRGERVFPCGKKPEGFGVVRLKVQITQSQTVENRVIHRVSLSFFGVRLARHGVAERRRGRLVRPTVAEAMVGKQKTLDFSKKWWYINNESF